MARRAQTFKGNIFEKAFHKKWLQAIKFPMQIGFLPMVENLSANLRYNSFRNLFSRKFSVCESLEVLKSGSSGS